MFNILLRRVTRLLLLAGLTIALLIACDAQQSSTEAPGLSTRPLVVASSPWPGFAPHYVALEKEFFQAEGILVEDNYFQIATDVNTALLAGRVDLAWTGVPDMVMLAERDPSLRLLALSDYSNGADGILARNVSQAQDLKGKKVAWEQLPLQALLLRKYLETSELTEKDITLLNMPAAEAATAFASKQVDVAVTYEPWLSKAAQEGQGEIIFSSKNTNIIAVGLVAKESAIQQRRAEILAFLRAIDKGAQFVRQSPDEMSEIVAQKLGVESEEVPALLDTVRMFNMEENATVVFNSDDPLNVLDSIEFAAKTSQEINLISQPVDATRLYDDSLVKEL